MNLKNLFSSLLVCTCFLGISITNAQAPDHLIKGTITGKNGNPLPGVTVQVKGHVTEMSQTNPDGSFSLHTKSVSGILVCSNVGYAVKEVPFGENKTEKKWVVVRTSVLSVILIPMISNA